MTSTPLRPTAAALARYPIPAELIASLYRADESEFARLIAAMPEYGRARVAAYCIGRERLQLLGLKIAAECEEAALVKAAGAEVGSALFAQSRVVVGRATEPSSEQDPTPTQMLVMGFPPTSEVPDQHECPKAA